MNNLAPGYSSFSEPLTHQSLGTVGSLHSTSNHVSPTKIMSQEERNQLIALRDDRMGVDEEEV